MRYRYGTLSKTDVGALDLCGNLKSINLTAAVYMSGRDKVAAESLNKKNDAWRCH